MGKKRSVLAMLTFLVLLMMSTTALAANAGWKHKGSKIYYYFTEEDSEIGTVGKKATGLQTIGQKTYYFSKKGVLQTGWVSTPDGYRYFSPEGTIGARGAMCTGLKTIGKYKYYFDQQGVVVTGLKKVKKDYYFFSTSTKLGTRGRSQLKKWKKIAGAKRYFGADGKMARNCWVKNTYYVDGDGIISIDDVTVLIDMLLGS